MTNKEYLQQGFRIDERINSKLEQVASLKLLATKATSTLSNNIQGSRDVHSKENIIVKMIDMECEINKDIDELVDFKSEITNVINSVEDKECQLLLEKRYICFKPWEAISLDMGYSLQHIFRLHTKALKKIKR